VEEPRGPHRPPADEAGLDARHIAAVTHGLSNGLTESVNTKLRLITRIAYGFESTDNLIALCLLDRGGYCPDLPGRNPAA
jgi:transposase